MLVNEAVHDPQINFTNPYLRTLRLEDGQMNGISTTQDVQGQIQLLDRQIHKAL